MMSMKRKIRFKLLINVAISSTVPIAVIHIRKSRRFFTKRANFWPAVRSICNLSQRRKNTSAFRFTDHLDKKKSVSTIKSLWSHNGVCLSANRGHVRSKCLQSVKYDKLKTTFCDSYCLRKRVISRKIPKRNFKNSSHETVYEAGRYAIGTTIFTSSQFSFLGSILIMDIQYWWMYTAINVSIPVTFCPPTFDIKGFHIHKRNLKLLKMSPSLRRSKSFACIKNDERRTFTCAFNKVSVHFHKGILFNNSSGTKHPLIAQLTR